MASWGKVAALLRNVLRSSSSVRHLAVRCAVGSGFLGSVLGTGVFWYHQYHANNRTLPFAVHAEGQKEAAAPQLSGRKVRFTKFASVIYEDEPYMTPRDFLFSVMLENVDRKLHKRTLTNQVCSSSFSQCGAQLLVGEINKMLVAASKARAAKDLFRNLGDNGLISYTEYLFLLTILTKPHTGFHIAFKMLDVDGNEQVDKKEFLKNPAEDTQNADTTLQAYFFGRKGENKLQYQEFRRFMEDLQAEVQEMEFRQFSKGMDTMRREDFAEWLLHYTSEEDNEVYWENMRRRIPAGQSITFDEFQAFCLFTNNLEDFAISLKMVTGANRPVGMAQFKRAVRIATGNDLSDNVLDTVFKLFDTDGDNCLSHKEFLGVMTDRVLRGLKVPSQSGLCGYWKCVKRETLKGAQEALGNTRGPI
ncbi:Calcium uptake protein 2, mitochondrial EF-hand domain-containing family member A1 Precursor [Channa argus]|uniref:Calcium uptake protein 2, mitochondrial EF-hand domain-containing family member A1 n=1 Tax=Channa argus TaxID=215402 RepID=A0A6G1QW85_CHAAH|nr:Calcium uptake protein 2, mitochondrial EF-hand domain-containing family member A1 Precursor [Channa argus]